MRSKFFIAAMATAITMSSCDLLTVKTKGDQTFNLNGRWKLESISKGTDTTQKTGWFHISIDAGAPTKGSSQTELQFNNDTVVSKDSEVVSDTAFYNIKDNILKVKSTGDTAEQAYAIEAVNDSVVSLTGVDSTIILLKKVE